LLLSDLSKLDVLFAIHELFIKYKAPARLDDLLTVHTEIKELKACSFTFEQVILNQNEQIICNATVKAVCVNHNMKPQKLPRVIKELN
jgi:acyl-CoA thioester hydrolase